MAALERVMQMRREGFTDRQMIDSLRAEGVSPKDINDALSQSEIKSELTRENQNSYSRDLGPESGDPIATQLQQTTQQSSMQPSLIASQTSEPYTQAPYEENQEGYSQESYAQYNPQNAPSPYPPYQAQQYPDYPQYSEYAQSTDLETINEIASQIVEEKNEELKKQITTFSRFKEEISTDVERLNQRLQKIENLFNDLQMAILKKMGDYGQDIKNIAKEMHATQDSFSKVINPLIDLSREDNKEKTEKVEVAPQRFPNKNPKKVDPGFENYLR